MNRSADHLPHTRDAAGNEEGKEPLVVEWYQNSAELRIAVSNS
jgi:hypothetical protein